LYCLDNERMSDSKSNAMNSNRPQNRAWLRISLGAGVLLVLVMLISLSIHRVGTAKMIRISINNKGAARLGPIPLQNEKVRGLVLAGVHRVLPNTPFEVSASQSVPFSNVVSVMTSLLRAGVPAGSVPISIR